MPWLSPVWHIHNPQLSSLLPVTCATQPDWISNTYPPLPPPPPPRTKCMHFRNIYTINRICMKFNTTVCFRKVSKILAAYFDFFLNHTVLTNLSVTFAVCVALTVVFTADVTLVVPLVWGVAVVWDFAVVIDIEVVIGYAWVLRSGKVPFERKLCR